MYYYLKLHSSSFVVFLRVCLLSYLRTLASPVCHLSFPPLSPSTFFASPSYSLPLPVQGISSHLHSLPCPELSHLPLFYRPLSTAYKYAVDKGLRGQNSLHQLLLILLHICSRSVRLLYNILYIRSIDSVKQYYPLFMTVYVSIILTEDSIFKGHGVKHLWFHLWCCRDGLIILIQLQQMLWGLRNAENLIICCSICDWVFLLKLS